MATLTHVGDKYLVFGMNWNTVKNTKKDMRSVTPLGKKFDAAYKTTLILARTVSYGFINHTGTLTRKPRKGELLSGAALFSARAAQSAAAILVLRLDESKRAAIVAIEDGKPYLDVVVPLSQVEQRLKALYSETGTAANQWDLFTNWKEHFESAFDPSQGNQSDEQFRSAQEITAEELKRQAGKNAILTKFVDQRFNNALMIIVALIAILMIGKLFWEKQLRRHELEQVDVNAVNPLLVYQQQIRQILPTLGFSGTNAKTNLMDTVMFRTTQIAGWKLDEVTCIKSGLCTELWSYQNGGTNASFAEENKIGKPRFSADGMKITNVYQLRTKPTRIEQPKLPAKEAFWLDFTTLLQQLHSVGMTYSIGQPALLNGSGTLSVPPGAGILTGPFSITGALGLASDTLLSLPENVAINSIKLTTSGELSTLKFEIKGNFYVKN